MSYAETLHALGVTHEQALVLTAPVVGATLEEFIDCSREIVTRMTKRWDPDLESLAVECAWNAHRAWNPQRQVPWRKWVAICTKRGVWEMWRKQARRREQLKTDKWWDKVPSSRDTADDLDVSQTDYKLLVEYYVDKWPLDVVAKRYNCSLTQARQKIKAAVSRIRKT